VSDFDEKTRVTVVQPQVPENSGARNDCLVVIYTKEATLLGKRFVLDRNPTRAGRGADSHIVLDGDSVSRRHCHFESRNEAWFVVDDGSTNGTYVNDDQISSEHRLDNGDRIKIGPTIFKYLSGTDVESQYHEEIYRLTIMDGLTQVFNKRYLFEAIEREMIRARRHQRELCVAMFDIDHFKQINDHHGHLAGDFVLKELARVVQSRVRRDEVVARYGGEEFVVMLPETTLEGARQLGETLRSKVQENRFVFQGETIQVTISVGCAAVADTDRTATEVLKRVDEKLYEAKRTGRNRVCA